eukprot:gene9021-10579_t
MTTTTTKDSNPVLVRTADKEYTKSDLVKHLCMGDNDSLRENEEAVRDFHIPKAGYNGDSTHYKYPLTGEVNTIVTLYLLNFVLPNQAFPWLEYYVRAGWTIDGQSCWVQLLDRKQQRIALVLIPYEDFNETETVYPVLIDETSSTWINVMDHLCFVDSNRLIWTSESTGYRHLYLYSWDSQFKNIQKQTLTQGDWPIIDGSIWVDLSKQLVYFIANKDTPLEAHLYVCSFAPNANPDQVTRLTLAGFNHTEVQLSKDHSKFVSNYSSLSAPTKSAVYQLTWQQGSVFPQASLFTVIGSEKELSFPIRPPTMFSFQSATGEKLYGCYYVPENYNPSARYPTLLYVYGGPHVQLVKNQCTPTRQFYSTFGFITVMIDNVGSFNRGSKFEGHIRCSMGQLEVQDQVDGLTYLINNNVAIDPARIAVSGWSYGGYLSLMCMAQRPDFFKMAISGAPVTLWETYNTGYTERYMDTPQNNPKGYEKASNGKPYILKILPAERHGIRDVTSKVYIDAFELNHLLKHL